MNQAIKENLANYQTKEKQYYIIRGMMQHLALVMARLFSRRILPEVSVKGELHVNYHWQDPFVITTAIRKRLLRLRKLTETRW